MVAAWLLEIGIQTTHGVGYVEDVNGGKDYYPELDPLCLTLSKGNASTQEELNASLMTACTHGFARIAKFLLSRGANPNAYNPKGLNALHCLVLSPGYHPVLVYSCDIKESFKNDLDDPTIVKDIMTALVAHGLNIQSPTQTTHIDECSQPCLRRPDCTHRGETAIHLTAMKQKTATLSMLVEYGADIHAPDRYGHTAFYRALEHRQSASWQAILSMSANKNPIVFAPTGSTAFHIACRFGYVEAMTKLLAEGAPYDLVDHRGYTPLHEVLGDMSLNQVDLLDALVLLRALGAEPNPVTTGPSIQELAEAHPRLGVRDMFEMRPRKREQPGPGGLGEAGESSPDHEPSFGWKLTPPDRHIWATARRMFRCLVANDDHQTATIKARHNLTDVQFYHGKSVMMIRHRTNRPL
ncbi:ankyrin repeat-containing domain protein [Xylaria telfairii]|nr:ankyrin repeat-containing domain protein [Xylaria telfairii]